ncbi:hypothetical protein [Daejeonella oryzae]|uniref:hypothetical protein n=1 Tax=Daejeonella oryzae TaxID=1122943 RepID=UPI00047BBF0F|nr:hypothetical protein [Daejeonella oryzae]
MTTIKAKIYSTLILLSSGTYFFLAYIGYKGHNVDLEKVRIYSRNVTDIGEMIRHSSKHSSKVFY